MDKLINFKIIIGIIAKDEYQLDHNGQMSLEMNENLV
jgi:hypothetical protein